MSDTINMPDAAEGQAINQAGDQTVSDPSAKDGRKVDRLFKRNIIFVIGFMGVMIAIIVVVFFRMNGAMKSSAEKNLPAMDVGIGPSDKGAPVGALTPAEIERFNRVSQKKSEEAKAAGNSFIPKDMPLNPELKAPMANDQNGPGGNYNINAGRVSGQANRSGSNNNSTDPRRDQLIGQGLEKQVTRILAQFDAPGTAQASPYEDRTKTAQAATSAASAPDVAASAPSGSELLPGLSIFGAYLTSPLDTAKTNYISARITSGPASGAVVFGTGEVVGTEGVRLSFTMMSFEGKSYPVKAIALDVQTSSNAMTASIDRQIFSRYVIPIFGAVGQAYARAIANPGQQVVTGVAGATVAEPAVSARQAGYAGVAAGLGKLTESATYTGPNTAFMPVNAPIGLLFTESVKK